MEDFDYSEYDTDTLRNVITDRSWDLKATKNSIKRMEKKLVSRRGYSHKQLDNLAANCRSAQGILTVIEIEIDECVSEIMRRNENV
tara:strand:+ start:369 stop:626 length:258 start_codon:yes stop_codon:yes gene_type:complete